MVQHRRSCELSKVGVLMVSSQESEAARACALGRRDALVRFGSHPLRATRSCPLTASFSSKAREPHHPTQHGGKRHGPGAAIARVQKPGPRHPSDLPGAATENCNRLAEASCIPSTALPSPFLSSCQPRPSSGNPCSLRPSPSKSSSGSPPSTSTPNGAAKADHQGDGAPDGGTVSASRALQLCVPSAGPS